MQKQQHHNKKWQIRFWRREQFLTSAADMNFRLHVNRGREGATPGDSSKNGSHRLPTVGWVGLALSAYGSATTLSKQTPSMCKCVCVCVNGKCGLTANLLNAHSPIFVEPTRHMRLCLYMCVCVFVSAHMFVCQPQLCHVNLL